LSSAAWVRRGFAAPGGAEPELAPRRNVIHPGAGIFHQGDKLLLLQDLGNRRRKVRAISGLRDYSARLTFELDSCMEEVHSLVRAIYRA
jgi:hypothetical protein